MSIQSLREKINLALYDSKEGVLALFKVGSFLIATFILSLLVYQYGFNPSPVIKQWILVAIKGSFVFYILKYLTDLLYSYEPKKLLRESWFEGLLLVLIILNASSFLISGQSLLNWLGQQLELFQLENYYILFLHFITAVPGLFTAVIIVGGVLSGIFTVTESGAFGTLYAFIVTIFVYRALTWENFKIAVTNSVKTTSMVMILVASASAFGYMLTYYQVPSQMITFMNGISTNPIVIFLMI